MNKTKQFGLVGVLIVLFVAIICCAVWYNADKFVLETREPAMQRSLIAERLQNGSEKQNITYCNNQKLDFYTPNEAVNSKSPLLIYVHGGGWHMNNKDSDTKLRGLFDGLRAKGYAIASIDYSLTPQNQYPKPQQDVLCAVRFMRANATRFAVDTDKFAIAGFSAGANLSALLGANTNNDLFNNGLYKRTNSTVQAVIGIGGVYDFTANLRPNSIGNIKNLMQDTKLSEGSPSSYVNPKNAPTLLLHGSKDSIVYPAQSVNFGDLLSKNNVTNKVIIVTNAEHDLSSVGGSISPSEQEITNTIADFLKQQFGQ